MIVLESRVFSAADQDAFAAISGDCNPIHMDAIAARRTQAGAPIVHGIHILIWALDVLARRFTQVSRTRVLKVRFAKMVYVGDRVDIEATSLSDGALRASASVEGIQVATLSLGLGVIPAPPFESLRLAGAGLQPTSGPLDIALDALSGCAGHAEFFADPLRFEEHFPDACRALGRQRIAALGCTSYIVGMVVPGLHSIYGSATLQVAADDATDRVDFMVSAVNIRFRRVELAVRGAGLAGTLVTFSRSPPVHQPDITQLAEQVQPGEFSGVCALVVGGSRGLGELTAKLIAAGGGDVIITYATGVADAQRVVSQINDFGARGSAIQFDVRADAHSQLLNLPRQLTQLYYFATPTISRRKTGLCSPERLTQFNEFYVHGFLRLMQAALPLSPGGLSAFYPSTVFIENRPQEMLEYAMSKAAGELLCAEINRCMKGAHVLAQRLPKLATDQTAGLISNDMPDAVAVVLRAVRLMSAP